MANNFRAQSRNMRGGGSIAEFGPVLFILLIVVMLPLISIISFVDGVATVALAANASARAAAPATTLTLARQNMDSTGQQVVTKFGVFVGMKPNGANPLTLNVIQINATSGERTNYAGGAVDTNNNFYEYEVVASYFVRPLFWPQDVPVRFASTAHCEHPDGLQN